MALTMGSRGADVLDLQKKMAAAGFNPGSLDGIYGAKTDAAFKQYSAGTQQAASSLAAPKPAAAAADPLAGLVGLRSTAERMGGTVGWDPASGPSVNGAKIDTTGMKNVGGKWYGSNQNIMGQLATVKAPDYVNPNQTDMDALVKKILNPEAFAYDPTTDPAYQSLLSRYTQEGDRAFANTMVDLNANTGGELNSWAVSGASNARNDMVSQAQDSIPALMQAAYGMYSDKQNQTYKQFDALNGLDSTSYNRFRDTTGDFQTNVKNALGLMDTADATTRDTRNFNRDVAVSDRNYTQDVAVSDRNFAQDVKTSDRNYALAVRAENRIGRGSGSGSGSSGKNTDITKLGTQPQIDAYYQFLDIFSGGGNGTYKGNAAAAYSRLIGKRGEIEKQIGSKLYKQLVSDVKGIDTVGGQPAAVKPPIEIAEQTLGAIRSEMLSATDPEAWLIKEAPYMTDDEIKQAVSWLPKKAGQPAETPEEYIARVLGK